MRNNFENILQLQTDVKRIYSNQIHKLNSITIGLISFITTRKMLSINIFFSKICFAPVRSGVPYC